MWISVRSPLCEGAAAIASWTVLKSPLPSAATVSDLVAAKHGEPKRQMTAADLQKRIVPPICLPVRLK
jgi:hypothetical protein